MRVSSSCASTPHLQQRWTRETTSLAGSIRFSYKEEKVRAGTVTASEVKYVTLRDIVLEANADIARMQQQAFVDFLTHLYTTPPVSAENIKQRCRYGGK
jgi:uncharacterized protein YjbK